MRHRSAARPGARVGIVISLLVGASAPVVPIRAAVEPGVIVDISWTRPGTAATMVPPAAARVGDEVTVAVVTSGVPEPICEAELMAPPAWFVVHARSSGASNQCTPWTFVIPPTSPGTQSLSIKAYSPDASNLVTASASFQVEAGGITRPFVSNYPSLSWAPEQTVGPVLTFGESITVTPPANASTSCEFGFNGSWWSGMKTYGGACAPWHVTLPEMRPDGFRSGQYGYSWQTSLMFSASAAPLPSGEVLSSSISTGEILVDGPASDAFASDRPAAIFRVADNPRFQYPGEINLTPTLAGFTTGKCKYFWTPPGSALQTKEEQLVGGQCPSLAMTAAAGTVAQASLTVTATGGSVGAHANTGVQVVDLMPNLEVLGPDSVPSDVPTDLSASTTGGAPQTYSFDIEGPMVTAAAEAAGARTPGDAAIAGEMPSGVSCSELAGALDVIEHERTATARCSFGVGGTYTIHATFVDAVGGTQTSSRTLVVQQDTTAPSVSLPTSRLVVGSALGSSRIPVRIGWSGSDGGSGIQRFSLQESIDGGAWSTVDSSLTSPSVVRSLARNHTYRYRVQAVDRSGNRSSWRAGASFRLIAYQESSNVLRYGGVWRYGYPSSAYGGRLKYATAKGARASVTFTGKDVAWVAPTGPTRGRVKVYINGTFVARVSLYSAVNKARQIVFSRHWSTSRTRTLSIVLEGTAGHPRGDVDAIVVLR